MKAPRYLVERWQAQLEPLFNEPDRQSVLEWLMANHDRKRVVLVGSGFSLNAKNPRSISIPLWEDISKALAVDLGVLVNTFDPLSLADFHRRTLGPNAFQAKLLGLLDDAAVKPGAAHAALWRSNPEAVITTNFLDTLLEHHASAQAVRADPDLALSTGPGKAQVIYFHGHRSDFRSWVVGRSDYDDLPERRPMLFARARQLFAQFPLLVVGYSLTDPDFHLVYRQMVRAMDRCHPMGLAVMLPRDGEDSEQARRAAKKYWEDLNLRIVQFRSPKPEPTADGGNRWEKRFVDFFDLTKRIEHRTDLEKSYVVARVENVVAAFRANVEVMHSAFHDTPLGHVWMRSSAEPSRFWIAALRKALPKRFQESASKRAQEFNLERRPHATSDGTNIPLHQDQDDSLRSELRQDDWMPSHSDREDSRFDPLWKLFERQQGQPFIWNLHDLLQEGVDCQTLAGWLRVAVERPEILDEPSVDSRVVMCGLLFLTAWREPDVQLVRKRAASRFSDIEQILGQLETSPPFDPPIVALLKQARRELEMGNYGAAHKSYAKAAEDADACSELDAPLLTYFALQGCADTTPTPNFSSQQFEAQSRAIDRARAAREHPSVRQWWDRVERFKTALARWKLDQLEQELVRGGYESKSLSFSNSSWHLDVIRQDAVQRGAPLSIEGELTMTLLGAYDSEYSEFEERLRLGLDKTGSWLSRQVTSGDMFRHRARSLFADRLQAGASERTQGTQKLGELLFSSANSQTVVRRRAVIDVLTRAAEILRVDDVSRAIAEIAQAQKDDPNGLPAEALASIARVCKWDDVKEQILSTSEGILIRNFRRSAEKFPWEHWITCDDFLARDGDTFLEALLGEGRLGYPERFSVGWALVLALGVAPEDPKLVEMCGRFASEALENDEQDGTAREQIANFASCSRAFVDKNPNIESKLTELLDQGNTAVMRILAGTSPDSDWAHRARAALVNAASSGQSNQTIEEVVVAKLLFQNDPHADWNAIRTRLNTSWDGLPELAPILIRDRWSPGDWKALQALLRVGGHRGKSSSWLIGRLKLIIAALEHDSARGSLFDDSPQGLGFLRTAAVEALGSGDGVLANRAIYGLTSLAPHVHSDSDAEAVAAALIAAADDVRINVAHGAAFVAHHVMELRKGGSDIHEHIADAAQNVAQNLQSDPLAIVRRQAAFGAAKGRQAAAQVPREGTGPA